MKQHVDWRARPTNDYKHDWPGVILFFDTMAIINKYSHIKPESFTRVCLSRPVKKARKDRGPLPDQDSNFLYVSDSEG